MSDNTDCRAQERLERIRRMTPSEKWQRIGELKYMLRSFFKVAVRLRNPGFTERQVHREVLLHFVGEKLVNEMIAAGVNLYLAFPPDSEIEEGQISEPFSVTFTEPPLDQERSYLPRRPEPNAQARV